MGSVNYIHHDLPFVSTIVIFQDLLLILSMGWVLSMSVNDGDGKGPNTDSDLLMVFM